MVGGRLLGIRFPPTLLPLYCISKVVWGYFPPPRCNLQKVAFGYPFMQPQRLHEGSMMLCAGGAKGCTRRVVGMGVGGGGGGGGGRGGRQTS